MHRRTEAINFQGRSGQLKGTIEYPARENPRAVAVFAHCFACGRNSLAAVRIARLLADCGIATLRFDFAGIGESEGQFGETGLLGNADDIVAATSALAENGLPCNLLIGHSYGGAAAIAAASENNTEDAHGQRTGNCSTGCASSRSDDANPHAQILGSRGRGPAQRAPRRQGEGDDPDDRLFEALVFIEGYAS